MANRDMTACTRGIHSEGQLELEESDIDQNRALADEPY
jgi:hypothetical protein